jgi:hypothetical protein
LTVVSKADDGRHEEEAGMKLYCGIGLHSNNCVVVVSDEEDRIVLERRVRNGLSRIEELLAR